MTDKYLELANSPLGKKLFSAVGLPDPVPLRREDPSQPHKLWGQVLLGASEGSVFAQSMDGFITAAGADVCRESLQNTGHLLFDASGITNAQQSEQLYRFFNQHIKSLAHSGRVIILGHKPSARLL